MTRVARILALALALTAFSATSALAGPRLGLDVHHAQTNAVPGGSPTSGEVRTPTSGSPSSNERQEVYIYATTGEYRLGFKGASTVDLPHDANAAAVQAALRDLPTIGSPNVMVAPVPTVSPQMHSVTFTGALANTDVEALSISDGATRLGLGPDLRVDVENRGDTATSGPVTLRIILPAGLKRNLVRRADIVAQDPVQWSCPGAEGDSVITCTTSDPIPRHNRTHNLAITLDVDLPPTFVGPRFVRVEAEGGGAAEAPAAAACAPGLAACAIEQIQVDSVPAEFGILAETFLPDFTGADGITPEREAGSHPERLIVPFDLTSVPNPGGSVTKTSFLQNDRFSKENGERIRNLVVDLPPGFVGNPTAAAECSPAGFFIASCPASSQVGMARIKSGFFSGTVSENASATTWQQPIFNITHPRGSLTDLAFIVSGNPVHIKVSLDPANGYAVRSAVSDINETLPIFSSKVTIWGVPADPSHDSERCKNGVKGNQAFLDTSEECAAGIEPKPFLTAPARCEGDNAIALHSYDSWDHPGDFGPPLSHDLGSFTDCEDVPFEPTVSVAPTTNAADSPSGLDVAIELPQDSSCEQIEPAPPAGEPQYDCATATSPLKDAKVTLPEGLTVNAAGANGLAGCSEAEIGLGTDSEVRCPNGSKVADVEVTTPVLPDPVGGVVYLATPHANPFNTLLAGYIVLEDVDRGILVKIPGRLDVEEGSGRISGTFTDNPQLPFSKFELHFKGGAHSTLVTPPTCGTYSANADFTPWSGTGAVKPTSSFQITGGGCAGTEAEMPHSPGFDAGSESPIAGQHSPFLIDLRRDDGTQRFGAVTVKPPPGLVAKLAGTETCSDAALAAAESKSGREEQSSPSCPASSRIGTVHAAAGAGPSPYWAPGTAYLAGPYKGAPVSIAILTPAVAGPFDLGVVSIRSAVRIDPTTAEITAVSDPIPTSLEGIPLDVRRAIVRLDKPDFTLNGTSCNPFAVTGTLVSTLGRSADLNNRFQLGECRRLGFKPRVALQLFGGVKRGKYQGLKAVVRPRTGDANISSAVVRFPRSAFVAQEHIRTVCTRVQWAANACPPGSIYGKAIARTPLLDYPLEGNVYLRSSDNDLPDAVADFRGPAHQPIRFELAIANDSVKGALRNRVTLAPDVPVSYFRLQLFGGKKGLIVNSRNICRSANKATTALRAHNGRGSLQRVALFNRKCKVLRKQAKKRRAAKRRAHKRKAAAQRGGRSR